jgi:glutathione S-transferase
MITISAFKRVPDFAQGQVRDLRARWALEEARLPYRTRLLERGDQDKPEYRALQLFGQVPILQEDGRVLFESGHRVVYWRAQRNAPAWARTHTRDTMANRGTQFY